MREQPRLAALTIVTALVGACLGRTGFSLPTKALGDDCLANAECPETCIGGRCAHHASGGEECDDGNTVTEVCAYGETSCTVCATDCTSQPGATSYCGDGVIDDTHAEACDDHNTLEGDGCSSTCTLEPTCASLGMVAHWKLDESSGTTAFDTADGHDGTIAGTVTWTTGKLGGAAYLDGNGNHVNVPDAAALAPTTAITVAVWAKPATATSMGIVKSAHGDGWIAGWRLHIDVSPTFTAVVNADWREYLVGPVNTAAGWYNTAFVYDGIQASLYQDGLLYDAKPLTGPIVYGGAADLRIGGCNGCNDFEGAVDDVVIYNRALSAAEIAALYDGGASCAP